MNLLKLAAFTLALLGTLTLGSAYYFNAIPTNLSGNAHVEAMATSTFFLVKTIALGLSLVAAGITLMIGCIAGKHR